MPFDEFMEISLYDAEQGFFSSGSVRPGERGDFVTSPEVSPWFGRLLGRWALDVALSDDTILVEIGASSGSLLEPLIDEVGDRFDQVFAVEVSGAARAAISDRIPSVTTLASISDLPRDRPAVVISNEVLDNMPSRLVTRTGDGWEETRVDASDGALLLVSVDADPDLSEWCDSNLSSAPMDHLVAAQQRLAPWMGELTSTLGPFAACVVDYAGSTRELGEMPRGSVVRSYRSHLTGLDFLSRPGTMDITLDVNTDVLAAAAHRAGVTVEMVSQREFLADQGALDVLSDLRTRANEHASSGDVMAQLALRSESVDIGALMDESGLGGFSVFLMSRGLVERRC